MLCLYWCQDRGDEAVSGYVKTFDLLPSWTLDHGHWPAKGGRKLDYLLPEIQQI